MPTDMMTRAQHNDSDNKAISIDVDCCKIKRREKVQVTHNSLYAGFFH